MGMVRKRDRHLPFLQLRRPSPGEPKIDLLTQDVSGQLPGLMTGVILTPGGGSIYVWSLGNALVKLERNP